WFMFCVSYANRNHWLDKPRVILLFLIPIQTILLVWTNEWHYIYYASAQVDYSGPFPLLDFERGIGYWVHTIYFYFILIWGTILLLQNYRTSDPLFKRQTLFVFYGAFIPWLVNFI